MDPRDWALQQTCPVISVPKFGALGPMHESGHRLLIAADGLWLEVRRPWLQVRLPLACQSCFTVPYGALTPVMQLSFGQVPPALKQRFLVEAQAALPNEHVAWLGGTAYAPTRIRGGRVNMTFANGLKVAPATISGQYTNAGTLVNGNIIIQGHESQPISVSANFDATLDDGPVAMANVVGNYQESFNENVPVRPLGTLSVDAAGRITGTDPDGTFTGTFTIVDGSKNYQRMTLSFSPNGGGAARIFSGIAGSASPNATGQFRTFDFKLIDANGTLRYGWLRQ